MPSAAQMKVLKQLAEHAGQFRRGYGKSAAALARQGFAKRKHVSDDGETYIAKFAITKAGMELLGDGQAT